MSTADSCMMASSGNFTSDLLGPLLRKKTGGTVSMIQLSMLVTLAVGTLAFLLAARFTTVLDAILQTYAFMVSGLFIPTLGAFFWPKGSSTGALVAMIGGGSLTLLLMGEVFILPEGLASLHLDATIYGIALSAVLYIIFSVLFPERKRPELQYASRPH